MVTGAYRAADPQPPSVEPTSVDRPLFRNARRIENDEDENNADHHNLPLRDRASGTHTRGHPHADGGREPLHVMTFLASDNDTRAQKTNSEHSDHRLGQLTANDGYSCPAVAKSKQPML